MRVFSLSSFSFIVLPVLKRFAFTAPLGFSMSRLLSGWRYRRNRAVPVRRSNFEVQMEAANQKTSNFAQLLLDGIALTRLLTNCYSDSSLSLGGHDGNFLRSEDLQELH